MSRLEDLGVSVTRYETTHHTTLNDTIIDTSIYLVHEIGLPRPCGIRARFRHETLADKIAKIVVREVQTGDATFDDSIFIDTTTPQETALFLADDEVRAAVLSTMIGGDLRINDVEVYVKQLVADEKDVVTIVRALLSAAGMPPGSPRG